MFDSLPGWSVILTWDTFYAFSYHTLVFAGFMYMYLSIKGEISPKYDLSEQCDSVYPFLADECWFLEHTILIIAYALAIVYGHSEIGRFTLLLLFTDMLFTLVYIPTQRIFTGRQVSLEEVIARVLRSIMIAVFLSTYQALRVEDKELCKIEIFNVVLGVALFFFGMKKKLANFKHCQDFPYNTDIRIVGAPDFEYVTSPDYFGELVQWLGFHIVCGNTASMVFVLYKAQVAIGEAYLRHTWYLKNSPRYPKKRAMIIPHWI